MDPPPSSAKSNSPDLAERLVHETLKFAICSILSPSNLTLQGSGTVESVSSLQRSLGLQETRTRIAFLENEQAELETEIRWVVCVDTQK